MFLTFLASSYFDLGVLTLTLGLLSVAPGEWNVLKFCLLSVKGGDLASSAQKDALGRVNRYRVHRGPAGPTRVLVESISFMICNKKALVLTARSHFPLRDGGCDAAHLLHNQPRSGADC